MPYEAVINNFGYNFKYYSKGSFYQIIDEYGIFSLALNIVMKDGQVERLFI